MLANGLVVVLLPLFIAVLKDGSAELIRHLLNAANALHRREKSA